VFAPNAVNVIAEVNTEIVKKMTSALNLLLHIVDSPYSWLVLIERMIPGGPLGSNQQFLRMINSGIAHRMPRALN